MEALVNHEPNIIVSAWNAKICLQKRSKGAGTMMCNTVSCGESALVTDEMEPCHPDGAVSTNTGVFGRT